MTVAIDEIVIMLCVFVFLILHHQTQYTEETRNDIGWIIIGLILFSIVKNFAVVILFGAQ